MMNYTLKNSVHATFLKSSGKHIAFLIALLICYNSAYAQLAGYSYKKKITIDNTKVSVPGSTDLIDFPFLVSLTDTDLMTTLNGGDVTDANGYDIVFTASDGTTLLDFELEKHVATTGEYVAWVRIPTLAWDVDTDIYIYYGNSSVTTDQSSTSTWNSNYKGVWHMNDAVTDNQTSGTHVDATGTHNGSQNNNGPSTGQIAGGQGFEGTTEYINIPDHNDFTFGDGTTDSPFSVSAWISGETGDGMVLSKFGAMSGTELEWELYIDGGNVYFDLEDGDDNNYIGRFTTASVSGALQYLTGTYDGSRTNGGITIYIDGVAQATSNNNGGTYVAMDNTTTPVQIGAYDNGGNSYDFNGTIDEVRISSGVRSADWIATEYANQNNPSSFYSVALEEVNQDDYSTWGNSVPVNINTTGTGANVATAQTSFPLLIRINDTNKPHADFWGTGTQDAGQDIRFSLTSNITQHFPYEIERWDNTNKQAEIWVLVDNMAGNTDSDYLTMHWDNGSAADNSSSEAVFPLSNGFEGAWHLGEEANTTAEGYMDASGSNNHATGISMSNAAVEGAVGKAQDLDGLDDYIDVSSHFSDYTGFTTGTFSGWFKTSSAEIYLFGIGESSSLDRVSLSFATSQLKLAVRESSLFVDLITTATYSDNSWHHFFVSQDASTNAKMYIDGSLVTAYATEVNSNDWMNSVANIDHFMFGVGRTNDNWQRWMDGLIDEFRVTSTARSADWIKLCYETQKPTQTTVTFGTAAHSTIQLDDFSYKKLITIDKDKVSGTAEHTDFPVLISFTDADLKTNANVNGYDIVFSGCDGITVLDHQLEKYDATTGEYTAWVRVPTLNYDIDSYIYIYYGNAAVTSDLSSKGVWDSNFVGVWHLHDDFLDGTSNAYNGTNFGSTDIAAQIADGQDFAGPGEQIIMTVPGITSAVTVSAWVKHDNVAGAVERYVDIDNDVVLRHDGAASSGQLDFYIRPDVSPANPDASQHIRVNGVLVNGAWYHVVGTYDGTTQRLYANGVEVGSSIIGLPLDPAGTNAKISNAGESLDGIIDEARISNVARSADWIATEYNNQLDPSTFFSVGTEAANAPVVALELTGTTSLCAGTTGVAYSVNLGITPTYTWNVVGGTINPAAGPNDDNITVDWGATGGEDTVFVSVAGCELSADALQVLAHPYASSISGSSSVGEFATGEVYTVTNNTDYTYAWTITGGTADPEPVSGQGTNSITVDWGAEGAADVSVIATHATCGAAAAVNLPVTISGSLTSSTVANSNTATVAIGVKDTEILQIELVVGPGSLALSDFNLSTTGTPGSTDAANDIAEATIYYTGTSSTFAPDNAFGSLGSSPNGAFTISGSQMLPASSTVYFWLAYDIAGGATGTNLVDAELVSMDIGGSNYSSMTIFDPAGSREIEVAVGDRYAVATGPWNDTDTWSATSGGAPGASVPNGENVVIEGGHTVTLVADVTVGNLTVSFGSSLAVGTRRTNINGDLALNGTITGAKEINFNGTSLSGIGSTTLTGKEFKIKANTTEIAAGSAITFNNNLGLPILVSIC